jgi:hypothetical protein
MALPARSGPRPVIEFRNHFSQMVGLLGRVISPSQGRYLNRGQHKHRINAYTHQTSMPWVGFESTIPASGRGKTVHALRCPYTYESGSRVRLGSARLGVQWAKLVSVWGANLGVRSCVCGEIYPSPAPESSPPSQTRTCMGTLRPRGHCDRFNILVNLTPFKTVPGPIIGSWLNKPI